MRDDVEDLPEDSSASDAPKTELIKSTRKRPCLEFCYKYNLVMIAVVLGLLLGTVVAYALLKIVDSTVTPAQYSCDLQPYMRIPCSNGGINASADECMAAGCCWSDKAVEVNGSTAPFCFHAFPSLSDYIVKSYSRSRTVSLALEPWNSELQSFNQNSVNLNLTVERVSSDYARIRAFPYGSSIGEVLWPDIPNVNESESSMLYGVVSSEIDERLILSIYRKSDNTSLVTMKGGPLILTGNYTEYAIYVPSKNIYGLGEADHKSLKHSMNFEKWQLFARSQLNSESNRHYYGVQPFYMCVEDSGNAHGVLLGLSQPSVISLQPGQTISVKTSGDLIEIHVFVGPTPKDVMRQYTEVIGRPALPPYWGLGYHTCRSNNNVSVARDVINMFVASGIPHESDCGDAVMLRSLSVSAAKSKVYHDFADISAILHSTNRKLLLFQGPNVINGTMDDPTSTFGQGVAKGIFMKNASAIYVGNANGKAVVYPDFRNETTGQWLNDQYKNLKNLSVGIQYDGMFLVDNTPLEQNPKSTYVCPSKVYIPPVSQAIMSYYMNDNDTICLTAVQPDQTPHYMWHNTYGHDHLATVASSVKNSSLLTLDSDRTMLVSLSTFSGSGKYAGHWGGEFETTWTSLNASLIQTLEYGLYGIPFTGNSICGYRGSIANEDICWKWMLMGSLLPMAFTYYGPNQEKREAVFQDEAYQTMTRNVLILRYSLLPYVYTLFYQASQTGEPVVRPMFFEFPHDNRTWNNAAQFMLGPSMLVSPSLTSKPGMTAYFPAGTWYEFQTQRAINSTRGIYFNLLASQYYPNIHVRAGSVIVTQNPSTINDSLTTVDARLNPYSVWATVDYTQNDSSAAGYLYIDDGLTSNLGVNVELGANQTAIWWTTDSAGDVISGVNMKVDFVSVTGLKAAPKSDSLCILIPESYPALPFHFDEDVMYLKVDISMLELNFEKDFMMTWA